MILYRDWEIKTSNLKIWCGDKARAYGDDWRIRELPALYSGVQKVCRMFCISHCRKYHRDCLYAYMHTSSNVGRGDLKGAYSTVTTLHQHYRSEPKIWGSRRTTELVTLSIEMVLNFPCQARLSCYLICTASTE